MASKTLRSSQVNAGVEERADEHTPEIVGGEERHLGLGRPLMQHPQHRLIGQSSLDDAPALRYWAEQRSGIHTTHL
jgi:hypothetical protein